MWNVFQNCSGQAERSVTFPEYDAAQAESVLTISEYPAQEDPWYSRLGWCGGAKGSQDDVDICLENSEFLQCYEVGGLIGTGTYGEVRRCTALDDCAEYAVKFIDKDSEAMQNNSGYLEAKDEVAILQHLRHPCIINLVDSYEDSRFLYVVMEQISGGDLLSQMTNDMSHVYEADLACIAAQMFSAIAYLHNLGIVHRDVKAENILLVDGSPARREANIAETGGALGAIRLIDFGFACFVDAQKCGSAASLACGSLFSGATDDEPLSFVCGSPAYVAPEILEGHYGKKVDVWAAAVVLYLTLFAQYPYWSENDPEETERLICAGEAPSFEVHPAVFRDWKPSKAVQKFLALLMRNDKSMRPDAKSALMHPWIQSSGYDEAESVPHKLPNAAQLRQEYIQQVSKLCMFA